MGIIPDVGASWLVPNLIGRAKANGLALLGDDLDAKTAYNWGLIWKCVPDDELLVESVIFLRVVLPKNFNDEIHTLFTDSFKKWRVTDSQLREFVKADVKVPKLKMAQKKPKKTSTPEFIKNVEFGPVRPK